MGLRYNETVYGVEFNPYLRISSFTTSVESENPKLYKADVVCDVWTDDRKLESMPQRVISVGRLTSDDINFDSLYHIIAKQLDNPENLI